MNQRFFIALLTVVMFGAGYAVRFLTVDNGPHVPAPPPALVRELVTSAPQPNSKDPKKDDGRAKLVADIEKYRRQIEAYRARVDEIYAEFDREFLQILTPAQQSKFAENQVAGQKRAAEWEAKHKQEARPPTDDEITRARNRSFTDIYWMVTMTPRLEGLTKDYNLDANQQMALRSLLNLRRDKFIALLDSTPLPSVVLNRIAPMIKQFSPTKTEGTK